MLQDSALGHARGLRGQMFLSRQTGKYLQGAHRITYQQIGYGCNPLLLICGFRKLAGCYVIVLGSH